MDHLNRKLTLSEIEEVATIELSIVRDSNDLSEEELIEFNIIIKAEMLYWTFKDYLTYMSKVTPIVQSN